MAKKLSLVFFLAVFTFSLWGVPARATSDHRGKLVKMGGLSSLYYVAADGKRYVFPNENTYKSWFTGYDGVVTLSETEIYALPLGGNVLYRPGVILVKITTDPKVYAVARGGELRWIKTEAVARALYGDNWNKLIDDVPDSFFTNYRIGAAIAAAADFDPDDEAGGTDDIDTNFGLSASKALKAQTRKCQIANNVRDCRSTAATPSDDSDDTAKPYITAISAADGGSAGKLDANDKITITFSEALDPTSVNSQLSAGGNYSSLSYTVNGAITVASDGLLTIKNIAAFDLGKVADSGQFAVKLALSSNAKVLTITLLSNNAIALDDEDFNDAKQIGGTIKDKAGNVMAEDANIGQPDGTFGGDNTNDGIKPYITAIKAVNGGSDDYIDTGDRIEITFSEEIDGHSINSGLDRDGSVQGVLSSKTGGVTVALSGMLSVIHIASFYVGEVDDNGSYDVDLALNSTGKILTITLAEGDDIGLSGENLNDAAQIGGTVEDTDGNNMAADPSVADPTGSFIGESTGSDLYIDSVKAYNYGYVGYVDKGDKLVITFNREVDDSNLGGTVDPGETGGVIVNANGLLTVSDILSFDIGEVAAAGEFEANLTLSTNKKALTIVLGDGDAVKIKSEIFGKVSQLSGTILDESGDTYMKAQSNLDAPDGTFGGDSVDGPPYIAAIKVTNTGTANSLNTNDKIEITFSEAIDPVSIHNNLVADSYVSNVDNDDTGGVNIASDGTLTITDIAKFNVGSVSDESEFKVKLALNALGNVLTITLGTGTTLELNSQDLSDAEQIGAVVKDEDDKSMAADPSIADPTGSF